MFMFCRTLVIAWLCLTAPLAASAQELLRYAGATTLQRSFMPEAARIFQGETGVRIRIDGGNSSPGIRALLAGEVDMAGSGRHLTAWERQQGLIEHFLGWDPVAIVVPRDNHLGNLSQEQLRGIFSGEIRNWRELGGRDEAIIVITPPKGAALRTVLEDLILGDKPFTPAEAICGVVAQADQQVAMFPGSISAVSLSMIDHKGIKLLAVDGVEPTVANVTARRYPLVKPLALVTRGQPRGQLERFIAFALGARGQAVLAKQFVPATGP